MPILSDNFFEFRERFFGNLTLLSTDANVIVSPSRADVFIDDDDGKFTSSFGVYIQCAKTLVSDVFPSAVSGFRFSRG